MTAPVGKPTPLSPAQQRYLEEITATPGRKYNGHAGKTLKVLVDRGLIRTEFDLVPHVKGGGMEFTYEYTCYPLPPAPEPVTESMPAEGLPLTAAELRAGDVVRYPDGTSNRTVVDVRITKDGRFAHVLHADHATMACRSDAPVTVYQRTSTVSVS